MWKWKEQQSLLIAALFLPVRVLGNTLTRCLFSITFDSKTDSKAGRQQWILLDGGGHAIGLWSGWKTLVDGGKQEMPKGGHYLACSRLSVAVRSVYQ